MAKRGENIYKRRDGRWEGRYIKGKKENGVPCFGYVYGHTYKEVRDKLLPLKLHYSGQNATQSVFEGTLNDWTRCWMEEVVRSRIKESTYAYYNSMLQKHILPYLGSQKLVKITVKNVQEFVDNLQKKGLRRNSLRNIAGMLNRVLEGAVKKKLLLANPCTGVELPDRDSIQISALNKSEQKRLENAAQDDQDGIPIMIALYTGMRIGEICGLRWSDIDFDAGTIRVQRTIQRIEDMDKKNGETKMVFGTPKSIRSDRVIPMPQKLYALLREEKDKATGEYVVSCKGHYAEPRVVRYRYQRIADKAGIKQIHFHGLRHTFATRCIEMQMDIAVISRILGHSSMKMTMDVYLDATLQHKAESIRKLDHLYDPPRTLVS